MLPNERRASLPCPECEEMIPVRFYPGSRGITSGPPDKWCPPDPAMIDATDACPGCGHEFDDDEIEEWITVLEEE